MGKDTVDVKELRKASIAIYAAVEKEVADHISGLFLRAAQRIEGLELKLKAQQDTQA